MSDYNKFKEIYDEIDELIGKRVDSSTPEFQAWKVKTERFLIKKYGEKSYELNNFRGYPFSLTLYTFDTTKAQFIEACAEDLKAVKAIFANYLEDMQEDNGDFEKDARKNISANNYKKVFIVHGHDAELKEATARLIERQGIKPIILHEQANKGATIIEKIEANSDVQAAICLFTADDVGKGKKEEKENTRARQNVVFETGYFIGKECIGCKLCYSVCPQKCIDISSVPVTINQNHCLHCGRCAEICPKQCIEKRGSL